MHVPTPPSSGDDRAHPKEKPPIAPGTAPHVADDTGTELPMPHERDERMDVESAPDPVIEQAKRDLDAGQVDTDLRTTPGLDAERRADLMRPPSGGRR